MDWNEKDVFIRIRQVAGKKIEIVDKHPPLIDFALAARWEESPEVKIDLEHRNKEMSAFSLAKLFEDIDTSLFKEGVDIRRAIDVIIWTIDGYANRRQEKIKTDGYFNLVEFEDSLTELDVYLGMLKDNFYRET
ncbi:hypothetical protein LJK88_50375 [Paenibacillus sp. P26]|nr:hypothetical protein LJK88_50375 [Paenibacillus sp. P26]